MIRFASLMIVLIFLIFGATAAVFGMPATLPPWVDTVLNQRVNDLLAEGASLEKKKEYSAAILRYLDALRLSPSQPQVRQALLRANELDFKRKAAGFEKRRRKLVAEAEEEAWARKAFQQALSGRMQEAGRLLNSGRCPQAIDQYFRILEEAPSYHPAQLGLEEAAEKLTLQMAKGGGYPTLSDKQVAQGFLSYAKADWLAAHDAWAPVLSDDALAKKWKGVRLGYYSSQALKNYEESVRREKINRTLEEGIALFRAGNLKGAAFQFEEVNKMDPSEPRAKEYASLIPGLMMSARADVLDEVEGKQMAQTLSDALEFYLKGFYDEARAKVQLVLDVQPDHKGALDLKRDIDAAQGLTPLPSLDQLGLETSEKMEALFSDGVIAFAEGRYDEAQTKWEEILKNDPTHARAQQALKKLEEEINVK